MQVQIVVSYVKCENLYQENKNLKSHFNCLLCSIQEGDLQSLAPRLHRQILPVVKKTTESQEDPSPGLREQKRKRGTGQEPSTLAVMMTRLMALFHYLDSLRTSRASGII